MKCDDYGPLNISVKAAVSIVLFDLRPGGGPFNLINASLSTVPVSAVDKVSKACLFVLFKKSIVDPQLSTMASEIGKQTVKDRNLKIIGHVSWCLNTNCLR